MDIPVAGFENKSINYQRGLYSALAFSNVYLKTPRNKKQFEIPLFGNIPQQMVKEIFLKYGIDENGFTWVKMPAGTKITLDKYFIPGGINLLLNAENVIMCENGQEIKVLKSRTILIMPQAIHLSSTALIVPIRASGVNSDKPGYLEIIKGDE